MRRFLSLVVFSLSAFLGTAFADRPAEPCLNGAQVMDSGGQGIWICTSNLTWGYQPISTLLYTQIGVANGVAPLGPDGKVSTVYLPTSLVNGNGTGPAGASVLSGTGAPLNNVGANGDFYIDLGSARLNFYGPKSGGVWPSSNFMLVGTGTAGTNGNTILNGTIAPGSGVGANGDFYLRTDTMMMYGPKASGAWPTGVSLIGPQGPAGNGTGSTNTILSGTGAPASGTGANGDFYIDTASARLSFYGPKASGAWPGSPTPLVGTNGTNGTNGYNFLQGSGVPASGLGNNNDNYVDTATGFLYLKSSGTWSQTGSLKGATGTAGSNGSNGTNGLGVTWRGTWSGATAYALNDAVYYSGSSYISILGGTNHQPDTSSTYWSVLAAKGDPGTNGTGGGGGLTGAQYADQNGNTTTNGIQSSVGPCGSSVSCSIIIPPSYATTELRPIRMSNIAGPNIGDGAGYALTSNLTFLDYRYGLSMQAVNGDGPYPGSNYRSWIRNDLISSAQNPITSQNYLARANTVLTHIALSGGVNENVLGNYNKSFYFTLAPYLYGYTRGQKVGVWNNVTCAAVGDCAGYYGIIHSHGTYSGNSDEGAEGINIQTLQAATQPGGQMGTVSGQLVTLLGAGGSGSPNAANEIGEGRYLIDTSSGISGNITAMSNSGGSGDSVGNTILRFTTSNTLTASTINTTIASGSITAGSPSTVTVASASGMSNGTEVTLSNDQHYEKVILTAVSGTSITFTSRYTYSINTVSVTNQFRDQVCIDADSAISTDFAGYLVDASIDSAYPKLFCLPVVRNGTGTIDAWWLSPNGGYQGYHGRWNNSTRAGYHAYKGLEVISVKDATLDQLSNTVKVEVAASSRFTSGDSFSVIDYFAVLQTGGYFISQKLFPSTGGATAGTWAYQMNGVWDSNDTAMFIKNNSPPTLYSAQGMTKPNGIALSGMHDAIHIFGSDCTRIAYCAPQYVIFDENTSNQPVYFKYSTSFTLGVFQANGTANGGNGRWEMTNYNNGHSGGVDMLTIGADYWSLRAQPDVYANLPTCNSGSEGTMKPVTDSNTNTWGATVAAGGSNHVGAYCNGTNWTVFSK